jgi:hypothetical protein
MQRKEIVRLASRLFAMQLLAWALVDLTYMPERLFSFFHYLSERSVTATQDFWSTRYSFVTMFAIARVGGLFLASGAFWRCSPGIEALLISDDSGE